MSYGAVVHELNAQRRDAASAERHLVEEWVSKAFGADHHLFAQLVVSAQLERYGRGKPGSLSKQVVWDRTMARFPWLQGEDHHA